MKSMKSERIKLYPFDNIDSVLDRLTQTYESVAGLDRLILEFPQRGRVIKNSVEFGRIASWGRRTLVQIVVLSTHEFIRERASEHSVPVVRTVEEAENVPFKRPSRTQDYKLTIQRYANLSALRQQADELRESPRKSLMTLPLFIVGIWFIGFILLAVVPHATIALTPTPSERSLTFYLWTTENLTELTTSGGIPSSEVRFRVQASVRIPTSGIVTLPPTFARGTVLVYNQCDTDRALPMGTRFLTGNPDFPEFRSTQALKITPHESAQLEVQSAVSGSIGNLDAATITTVESPFDRCIMVEQQYSFSGGSESTQPAVAEADIRNATEMLNGTLAQRAAERLTEFADDAQLPLDASLVFVESTVPLAYPPAGYAGAEVEVKGEAVYAVRVLSIHDVREQAKQIFAMQPGEGFRAKSVPIEVSVRPLPRDESTPQLYMKVEATQYGVQEADERIVTEAVRGMEVSAAEETLRALYGDESSPEIQVWPSRWHRLPIATVNIRALFR